MGEERDHFRVVRSRRWKILRILNILEALLNVSKIKIAVDGAHRTELSLQRAAASVSVLGDHVFL